MNSWHANICSIKEAQNQKYALQAFLNWLTSSRVKFGCIQIKARTVTSVGLWGNGGVPLFNHIRGTTVTWSCCVHCIVRCVAGRHDWMPQCDANCCGQELLLVSTTNPLPHKSVYLVTWAVEKKKSTAVKKKPGVIENEQKKLHLHCSVWFGQTFSNPHD